MNLAVAQPWILLSPVLPAGNSAALQGAIVNFNNEDEKVRLSTERFCSILQGVSFQAATRPFLAEEVSLEPQGDSFVLKEVKSAGLSTVFGGVIPEDQLIANPALAGLTNYVLASFERGFFKSAWEFGLASERNRPIIRGIAEPSEEDVQKQLAFENGKKFLERLKDLYYTPKSFERDGRLYEWIGIRGFKWLVLNLVGKNVQRLVNLFVRILLPGEPPPDITRMELLTENMKTPQLRRMGLNYHLGQRRSLDDLGLLDKGSRENEAPHAVGFFGFGYLVYEFVANQGLTGDSLYLSALYLANAYAMLLQRYNRVRIYNAVDLKLRRGPFSNLFPS